MQSVRYIDGCQEYMEPHKILPVVLSEIDILVICGDEGSYEETSERISAVPGGDRTGSLQETFADPPKCVGKELVGCLELIPRRENQYWKRTWRRT